MSDDLLDLIGRAIIDHDAACKIHAFDYSSYRGEAPPFVVRDCAQSPDNQTLWCGASRDECQAAFVTAKRRARARAVLAALGLPVETLRGLRDGSLVAVPREPTDAMKQAGNNALCLWVAPAMHADDAYRAMLAVRIVPETADE